MYMATLPPVQRHRHSPAKFLKIYKKAYFCQQIRTDYALACSFICTIQTLSTDYTIMFLDNKRRPLLQIWAIFALVLAILLWYSSWDKPLALDFEIKQASTKSIFAQLDSTLAHGHGTDTATLNGGAVLDTNSAGIKGTPLAGFKPAAEVVTNFPKDAFKQYDLPSITDTTSLYILLTGDSMTEELRFALGAYAKKNGAKLMTCTWYSSNTMIWSESSRLASLIREYRPSLIVFTLGSNELFKRDIADRERFIQDIIYEADVTQTPFVWVNPPAWKEDTGISELILKNVGKERHFDSRGLKLARKSDGAHPTRDGAKVWGDTIMTWLQRDSWYKSMFKAWKRPELVAEARPYRAMGLDTQLVARRQKIEVRILREHEALVAEPIASAKPTPEPSRSDSSQARKPAKSVVAKTDSTKRNPSKPTDSSNQTTPNAVISAPKEQKDTTQ